MRTGLFCWCLLLAFVVGSPTPLAGQESPLCGATVMGNGTQFSLYSEHATRIQLWVFAQPHTATPTQVHELVKGADAVWTVFVPGVGPGAYYGYRAWGPNWPYNPQWKPGTEIGFLGDVDREGNRYNPNKLLIDPYAKALSHDPRGEGYLTGAKERKYDTAAGVSKSIVIADDFDWAGDQPINRPLAQSVIYEVHLRGLTRNPSAAVPYAGTYRAVAEKAAELKSLGVTAVEFLPLHETINDQNAGDEDPRNDNYWGYMTLNYFSPDRRLAYDQSAQGPVREFKEMVKALHRQGLEVILDVVYNHTAEGGIADGDTTKVALFSFRGLDNQVYYQLTRDNQSYYDNTGCGSNVRVTHPMTHKMILDSLRYWVQQMHVDGFRFDLASVLGNTIDKHGFLFSPEAPLLREIREVLPGTKIIAEAWAVGDGTYQVGNFPRGWAEWNGKFRDTARKFILMEPGTISDLATRLCGSADLFGDDGRQPGHSINFITAHDGFTLYDLVSYDRKNNGQSYPYGPSDGGEDNNLCRNWGSEELKRQQIRNFAGLLFLAQGTPMLLGGDEFARTQRGNNNAYNLDTVCSWLDWSLREKNRRLWNFVAGMIALRQRYPALRRSSFLSGKDHGDADDLLPDIQWHGPNYLSPDWGTYSLTLAYRLDGSREETGGVENHDDLYIALNGWREAISFQLPPNHPGKAWYRVLDTDAWAEESATIEDNIEKPGQEDRLSDGRWSDLTARQFAGNSTYLYGLHGQSLVVFLEK